MPRKQREVERGLVAKGFQSHEGDHSYFHYWSKAGKKTAVFTKMVGDNDLGRSTTTNLAG